MNHQNLSISAIESAFLAHICDNGVILDSAPIADGLLHRIHVKGDRPGTKNGAYILHADGHPCGWYQHFNSGISGRWTLNGKRPELTKTDLATILAEQQARKREQLKMQAEAADKARNIWSNAKKIAEQSNHAYLLKKNVQPHGLRLLNGALIVPVYDESKTLVNVQTIQPDGAKRFLFGGRKKGCFSAIGEFSPGSRILIAEGWATGASLHEATEYLYFTVIALDAGNLKAVALAMRQLHPSAEILICGDNDVSGVGQQSAIAAASACCGSYMFPETAGDDWNDALNRDVQP